MNYQCVVCNSEETSGEMSEYFAHKIDEDIHLMCENCILEFVVICTCGKKINADPTTFHTIYVCKNEKIYFDIEPRFVAMLLTKRDSNLYTIDCCRGCRHSTEDIQTNITIGSSAAIEACIFRHTSNEQIGDALEYIGDALDENYIEYMKKFYPKQFENIEDVSG